MSAEALPTALDIRKVAQRGGDIRAVLNPSDLPRFRALLAGEEGRISARFRLSQDEEGRHLVSVEIDAEVVVECQRCLEPMSTQLACRSELAVVWTDEQAAALPKHLEPLIVEDQFCDLMAVVEEELILALPPFSYHDTEHCRKLTRVFSDPVVEDEVEEKRNPFDVLAQLKPGEKH